MTCVRSGENGFLYIDGVKVAEDQGAVVSLTGANTLFGLNNLTDGSGYNGLLDELRIYHKALSAEEIEFYANIRGYEFDGDADGDGLTNGEEYFGSTDMTEADIDGDGLNDKQELEYGTNPSVHNGNVKEGFEVRAVGAVSDYSVEYDQVSDSHSISVKSDDIWGYNDSFVFVAKPLVKNSRLTVKLTDFAQNNRWCKAGVMIRDSYEANSEHAWVGITSSVGTQLIRRDVKGDRSFAIAGYSKPEIWLTLINHNDKVKAYVSDVMDGGV
ncbi:MAG: hypothetical protein OIF51_20495, partial [Cellvibrionaceae bacterium]|nr:hypothetical protein [Cellvibrionaceae bacterium]